MIPFFTSRARARALADGPNGLLIEQFAEALFRLNYAEISARRHIRVAEHLSRWAAKADISVIESSDDVPHLFERHLNRCKCRGYGRSNRGAQRTGVKKFLAYVREGSVATTRAVPRAEEDSLLLTDFCCWMRARRGTADSTLDNYRRHIRAFLAKFGQKPATFTAGGIRQFVLDTNSGSGLASAKTCTTALRRFFAYLHAEDRCDFELAHAVPAIAHWRLSSLPRYLLPDEVERIIGSCAPHSIVGKRDRAILLLLARLGLRAGDVAGLRLDDVDWEGAEILVSGKSRRQTGLPLSQEVGLALAAYVPVRPQADTDVLFLCSRAPYRPFRSHAAISAIVARAMQRAGVTRPSRGAAHLLRHSLATSMLREGASLRDIADILRHRSVETTQIYAKVDVASLQTIAQPWPESLPC